MSKLAADTWLIFRRSLREGRRQIPVAYVGPALTALITTLIFTAVYGDIAEVDGFPVDDFMEWVAPPTVFLSVFLGAGFTAASLVGDVKSGYVDRLRLLPVRPASMILGRVLFDAVRAVPPAAIVLGVSLAFGAANEGGIAGFAGMIGLAAALAIGWNGIFYAAVLQTGNPAMIQALQPLTFMPAVMFSTFWVPKSFMPGWYEAIATYNPVSPVIDAGRTMMLESVDWGEVGIALMVIAGLGALTYSVAARAFSRLVTAD